MVKNNNKACSQSISDGLLAYSNWRSALTESIIAWQKWLQKTDLLNNPLNSQIQSILDSINKDSLNIAFVSEFSRGKTELINAIFFGDSDKRLLPSGAGRTTMCSTEIFYDYDMPLGLQLLPVETLSSNSSLDDLKLNPNLWTQLPFDGSNDQLSNDALKELSKTIRVPSEVAKNLGFKFNDNSTKSKSNLVEIPKWRHALVNIKHPLLENNLVIHDTPGLNALGIETIFTLETLKKAHSIVFIVDASTGATKSDKHIWDKYINVGNNSGQLVALNKLDALWSTRTDAKELPKQLQKIISSTSTALRVDQKQIHSVSAHNALIGKLENKQALVEKSRISKLERAIAENLIPSKKKVVLTEIFPLAQSIAKSLDITLQKKIDAIRSSETARTNQQTLNKNVMSQAMQGIRNDKVDLKDKIKFVTSVKSSVAEDIKQINELISDEFIESASKAFQNNLTKNIGTLDFREKAAEYLLNTYKQLHLASIKAEEANLSYENLHQELHSDQSGESPTTLNLNRHLDWLASIEAKYQSIERKPGLGPKKQAQRIQKLFEGISLATGRALRRARNDTNNWYQMIISPYENKVKHQTQIVKRRINNIQQIDKRIKKGSAVAVGLNSQLHDLIKKKRQLYALVHNINSHIIQYDYIEKDMIELEEKDKNTSNVVDIR